MIRQEVVHRVVYFIFRGLYLHYNGSKIIVLPARFKYKEVSFENFVFLGITYAVIMIGFGLLFLLLEMKGMVVFYDISDEIKQHSFWTRLGTSIYLSAITLFSVGFGDVVPVGYGRLLVVIEALLGYTIPAAFVIRTFIDFDPVRKS